MTRANPVWNRLIFVLSTAGLLVAGFLWYAHAHVAQVDIPCGGSYDCRTVALSPYARFPEGTGPFVAAYGTIGYIAILILSFLRAFDDTPERDRLLLGMIVAGSVIGTIFSLRLTYIEIFVIYAVCKWCVASQLLILSIALVSVLERLQGSRYDIVRYISLMKLTKEAKIMAGLAAAVVLGGGALALMTKMSTDPPVPIPTPPPGMTAADIDDMFQGSRHKEGDASATLTLVEFGDFECPSCRRAYNKTIVNMNKTLPSYRLAFYHLPLQMHPRAIPAAIAAEAAAKQGKFWPMYVALYDTKSEGLTDSKIEAAAKTAGVDTAKFDTDLKRPAPLKALVDADLKLALGHEIDTTPTFYIHDKHGNTAIIAGAGNLERMIPDLEDGVIGNDPISPGDPATQGAPIAITVDGKTMQK